MVTRAIAVLTETGVYAFAFENVDDAKALVKKASASYYGAKYSVFEGNVADFVAAYKDEDEDNIKSEDEQNYTDADVTAITHDVAQKYLAAGKNIWDIAQDAEEGAGEETAQHAWICWE
jgi:hypothetical protein